MRRAARVDQTHPEIVAAFRRLGYGVLSLAQLGKGIPDLLVTRYARLFWFVECKTGKGKLLPAQRDFATRYPVYVARTVADVDALHAEWVRIAGRYHA